MHGPGAGTTGVPWESLQLVPAMPSERTVPSERTSIGARAGAVATGALAIEGTAGVAGRNDVVATLGTVATERAATGAAEGASSGEAIRNVPAASAASGRPADTSVTVPVEPVWCSA